MKIQYAGVARSLVGLICCSVIHIITFPDARADDQAAKLEVQPIQAHDLAVAPLFLDENWEGGILRVQLIGPGSLPPDWRIHLDYGDGQTIDITASDDQGRVVQHLGPERVLIDLPVLPLRTLSAEVSPSGMRLQTVEVHFPSHASSLQTIGQNWKIDLFDEEVTSTDKKFGKAFGRLDLYADHAVFLGHCTGFRLTKGYWLTAGHCVAKDPDYPDRQVVSSIKIQPSDYANPRLEGAKLLTAIPVATGQDKAVPVPSDLLKNSDLDYALLQVSDDTDGPAFPLSSAVAATDGTKLELLEHWSGKLAPAAGKARSADANCVIKGLGSPDDDMSRPEICPNALQHGCSTEEEASGSPIVVRGQSLVLVGLHYRGGLLHKFNCALPATQIRRHLCTNKQDLARRITSCP